MNEKYQIAVIGTGSGGSEVALLAAKKGFKVIVIESGALGGTRLHRGSYAVRALHASARLHGEFFKGLYHPGDRGTSGLSWCPEFPDRQ
jgi:pyruvate/2-oxoglutarate dehydrogenase complex dihydrolipoamide dehydrogenase (E3) component